MAAYHMRRQERQITDEAELKEILSQGRYAVIAMCRGGEPYIVTLSYGYDEAQNALYFHTAHAGLKIDFIQQNPNVCATILEDLGYTQNACAHAYRSVVLFGKITLIEDAEQKKHGVAVILNHLEEKPDTIRERVLKSDSVYNTIAVLKLEIARMTGKKGQ